MGRRCTICALPAKRLLAVDRAILQRQALTAIAKRYDVSEFALGRHKKHMQTAMVKAAAQAQKEIAYGNDLLGELEGISNDVLRLQRDLEAGQDKKGALKAIHERLCALELKAKLTGSLDPSGRRGGAGGPTLTFEEAVKLALEIVEAAGFKVIDARSMQGEPGAADTARCATSGQSPILDAALTAAEEQTAGDDPAARASSIASDVEDGAAITPAGLLEGGA